MKICQSREYSASEKNKITIGAFFFFLLFQSRTFVTRTIIMFLEAAARRELERYSHRGYLIKAVVMTLAGEVTLELSPI